MKRRLTNSTAAALGLLSILACAPIAAPLAAQGVPAWAVGIEGGSGPRTERAGETYYRGERASTLRLAGQFRIASFGIVAPVLHLEGVHDGRGYYLADCPPAPNGTCRKYAPENGGWGIGAGLAVTPVRFVDASVIAGRGRYEGTYRDFLATRLGFSPVRHLAVTASLTHMTWKESDGYPHWFRPLHLGIRVQ